jgi:hypothetical protein
VRDTAATGWAVVGYSLALILLYVFVADQNVVSASSKLAGGATAAAKSWLEPTDPIAQLASKLGYTAASSSSSSSSSSSATSTGVPSPTAPSLVAVSPSTAGATGALKGLQDLLTGTPVNVSGKRLASVERVVKRNFPSLSGTQLTVDTQRLLEEAHTGKEVKPGTKEYSTVGG